MSMSILTNIEFVTNEGKESHVLSIEDAKKLYEELHELFGPTPVPVAPSEPYTAPNTAPYNPWIGPNPWVTAPMSKTNPLYPDYPIGSEGPLTVSWTEWSANATNE
jgi:hypothetical protein